MHPVEFADGTQIYGKAVIVDGSTLVGTNNGVGISHGIHRRLMWAVFRESYGASLWQCSSENLPIAAVRD